MNVSTHTHVRIREHWHAQGTEYINCFLYVIHAYWMLVLCLLCGGFWRHTQETLPSSPHGHPWVHCQNRPERGASRSPNLGLLDCKFYVSNWTDNMYLLYQKFQIETSFPPVCSILWAGSVHYLSEHLRLLWELTHWKSPWCWERLRAGGEGDDRGWDSWMVSLTQWTWLWVDSGSWWWTGRPGMLWFMGSQSVGHDWVTELNWNFEQT